MPPKVFKVMQSAPQRHFLKMASSKNVSLRSSSHNRKSTHFGDSFDPADEVGTASWSEVCRGCFVHTPRKWLTISASLILILACLYLFGIGLEFLGTGAKVMAGCGAGQLFKDGENPVAGVMIGILATVLLQSSSTTTSLVVGLVGAEDSEISVKQGIYMIMGANIGTTVTNTIVSLGHFRKADHLELAFAGATVHDIFNFLTVAILLPLEVASGYLNHLTEALVRGADTETGEKWEGPAKRYIKPLAEKVIIANKKVTNAVVAGGSCDDFYPIECSDPGNPTKASCSRVGLIACSKQSGDCPAFFDPHATQREDQASGLVVFIIGLFLIFVSLQAVVVVLSALLRGVSVRIIYKATSLNGYILIGIGCALTMMLQSSSTTTSFLTPVVGIGALRLEQMYSLTVGANLGTTFSALLSALSTDGNKSLQVALAHLMFNVTGMMIWYPIPAIRAIPIFLARRLGLYARVWRSFTLFYILICFFMAPGFFLLLSEMFLNHATRWVVLGSILTALVGIGLGFTVRWCMFQGGQAKFYDYLTRKRDRYYALLTLTTDMEKVKRQIHQHQEYASIPVTPIKEGVEVSEHKASPRQKERALRHVAADMAFVKEAIAMIYYHTGLPEEYEGIEGEDSSLGDHGDEETPSSSDQEGDFDGPTQKKIALMKYEPEHSLRQLIPKSFYILGAVAFVLFVVGVVLLFRRDGKAGPATATFLLVLFCIGAVLTVIELHSDDGRQAAIDSLRNHKSRNDSIQTLPQDLNLIKDQVKEILAHYRLSLQECTVRGSSMGSQETSSDGES